MNLSLVALLVMGTFTIASGDIVRIWDTDALYKDKRVYVAGANAIAGKRWGASYQFS